MVGSNPSGGAGFSFLSIILFLTTPSSPFFQSTRREIGSEMCGIINLRKPGEESRLCQRFTCLHYSSILHKTVYIILSYLLSPQFPEEVYTVEEFREPVVLGTLVTPDEHLGKLLALCQVQQIT